MTVRSPSLLIAAQLYGTHGHQGAQTKVRADAAAQRAEREPAFTVDLKSQGSKDTQRPAASQAQLLQAQNQTPQQPAPVERIAPAKPRNPTLEPFVPQPLAPAQRLDEGKGRRDVAPAAAKPFVRPGSQLNIVI